MDRVRDLASKNAAVIFTKSSCCMCHSIKTLFYELGASPAIHELDRDVNGKEMERALRGLGCNPTVPAVFIGGKWVGSAKDVLSLHLDGSLKQMLMEAKAIWAYSRENNIILFCSEELHFWYARAGLKLTCSSTRARARTGWIVAVLSRIDPHMAVGSKESCKLVGAAQGIAATESHLIPNLSAKGLQEGSIIVSIKSAKVEQMVNSMSTFAINIRLPWKRSSPISKSNFHPFEHLSKAAPLLNVLEIGVDPLVYEIDHDPEGREMEKALAKMGCSSPVPAVFIGGKLLGSTNEVMSLHLSGSLNQMLKPYQTQT
ncbi:hypothetical protein DKX38_021316 [Salix brachista]|uniref:Glutaredoxin domain-containing protein n=1 Tax=Salix brachista TaxID=2182728 RepID=A0A5N5K7F5_9ROSI|nr:hypothetical protein DKX38_021316 [Salix brachista]